MKYLFIKAGCSLVRLVAFFLIQAQSQLPIEFAIVITSYNNEKYAEENLQSAWFQKSTHPYPIYYVNDCSTDRTAEVVESFIDKHNLGSLITVINNRVNIGQVGNYYNVIHRFILDNKIVVNLDADDFFCR